MNKKQKCIISFIPSVCVFSYIPAMAESTHAEPDKRPNVIVLLTDDQGIGSLGCMGNELIHTPNMDAFAAQSVFLPAGPAARAVCPGPELGYPLFLLPAAAKTVPLPFG